MLVLYAGGIPDKNASAMSTTAGGQITAPADGAPTRNNVISIDNGPVLSGTDEQQHPQQQRQPNTFDTTSIFPEDRDEDEDDNDSDADGRGDFTHVLRYSYSSTTVLQAQADAGAIIDAEFKIIPLTQRRRGHQLVVEWVEHRQIRGSGNIEMLDDEMVAVASATLKMPPAKAVADGGVHTYDTFDNDRNGRHAATYAVKHGGQGELHFNKTRQLPAAKYLARNQEEHIVASHDDMMTVRSVDIHETSDMLPSTTPDEPLAMPGQRQGGIHKVETMLDHGQQFKFQTSSKTSLRLLGVEAAAPPSTSGGGGGQGQGRGYKGASSAAAGAAIDIELVEHIVEPVGLKTTTTEAHPHQQGSVPLEELEEKLDDNLECVFNEHVAKNDQDTGHHEGTLCFRKFRDSLEKLTATDLTTYAGGVLSEETGDPDEDYEYLSIAVDALTEIGTEAAQLLIVSRVFAVPEPDSDTVKRVMISSAALRKPIPELIAAVEILAHGEGATPELREIHVVNHATLALGAYSGMLYALNEGTDTDTGAARIVDTIAEKLPAKESRPRRAFGEPRTRGMSDWDSKASNILEALGNTAHPQAKPHILKHARDFSANILVRASSVHALRFHEGVEVEGIMTDKILFDPHQHVRETAHHAYTCPTVRRSKPLKQVHEDHRKAVADAQAGNTTLAGKGRRFVSFPDNFPDEMYSKGRARRSGLVGTDLANPRNRRFLPDDLGTDKIPDLGDLQDDILEDLGIADLMDQLHFDLQLPGFDWGLRVGVPDFLEAMAGIHIENGMFFDIDKLTAFFDANIDNDAYVSLVFMGDRMDLIRVKACFVGHIEFSLNIVKGLGLDKMMKMVRAFDELYQIVKNDLTEGFETIVDFVKNKLLNGNPLEPIINAVTAFPEKFVG
eukprot:gene11038-10989_t